MTKFSIAIPEMVAGRAASAEAGLMRVLVCRTAKGLRVMRDLCPHQALSMNGGRVLGESLICPHHGARFSLVDGHSMSPLTVTALDFLDCRETEGEIEIEF